MRPSLLLPVVCLCFAWHRYLARAQQPEMEETLSLTGEANWVVSDEDMAVLAFNTTLLDVARDFYKVLGYPPLYVDRNSSVDPLIASNSISTVYFGMPSNTPYLAELVDITECLSGPETHCLRLVKDPRDSTGQHYALVAIGETTRGAIYAAYSFSELVLGVDPLYRFSDIQPEYKKSVELESNFNATFREPLFEYRILFPNDEDLLGGFKADPMGESVFTLTAFDWFYETILRLKGNGVIVGTVPYPDEKSLELACRRGLVVADHHFNLLGLNTYRWPRVMGGEWNWQTNPATMSFAWRASATAMSRLDDILWSVGYRGLGDYAAPCDGCSDATKGRLVSEAIGNQTEWISNLNPEKPQQYMTYMWDEGLRFLSQGYLKLPEEVSIILSDGGVGTIGGLQYAQLADGVYTHVAMHSAWTNQLTELVPPSRHFDQLGQFVARGRKTKFIILNTSDLRPVLLTAEGVLRFVWDPKSHMNASSPEAAQTKYIQWWAARQFNVNGSIAAQIAELYNTYFNIPYIHTGIGDEHLAYFTSRICDEYQRDLSKNGTASSDLVKLTDSEALPMGKSLPDLRQLYKQSKSLFAQLQAENVLSVDRANFFQAHILTQHAVHLFSNEALNAVAMSILNCSQGDMKAAGELLQEALEFMDSLFEAQRAAETSHWRGLYLHSRLTDFLRTRTYIRRAIAAFSRLKTLPPARPSSFYTFTQYQFAHQPNFPLFYFNPKWQMDDYVRISCSNNDSCSNNATGGFFHMTANITMKVLRANATIHFTTDGSAPSSSSSTYTAPIVLQETTHMRACTVVDNTPQQIITDAIFHKVP